MEVAGDRGRAALLGRAGALLRARGERMTQPRRAVLTALAARGGHVSAEQVVADVAAAGSGAHRSSVYRTLEVLTRLGVVQHVHLGHGGTVYHPVEHEHPHVQCTACGELADLPVDLVDAVGGLAAERGVALDVVHVALSGTCRACTATSPPPAS